MSCLIFSWDSTWKSKEATWHSPKYELRCEHHSHLPFYLFQSNIKSKVNCRQQQRTKYEIQISLNWTTEVHLPQSTKVHNQQFSKQKLSRKHKLPKKLIQALQRCALISHWETSRSTSCESTRRASSLVVWMVLLFRVIYHPLPRRLAWSQGPSDIHPPRLEGKCYCWTRGQFLDISQLYGSKVEVGSPLFKPIRYTLEADVIEVLCKTINVRVGSEGFLKKHLVVQPSLTLFDVGLHVCDLVYKIVTWALSFQPRAPSPRCDSFSQALFRARPHARPFWASASWPPARPWLLFAHL